MQTRTPHRFMPCILAALALLPVWSPSASAADPPGEVTLARPTPQQYAWHEQERIMFVCFDPCTWQGREYDNHSTPLSQINPTQLDADQWCRAAKLWGAKEILSPAQRGVRTARKSNFLSVNYP